MSVLSLENPIHSANIYQLSKACDYLHRDFTVFLPLRSQIQISGHSLNESELFLLPPFTPVQIHPEGNCSLGCIRFDSSRLLSALESEELFLGIHTSSEIISLVDAHTVMHQILRFYNTAGPSESSRLFWAFADIINSVFPAHADDSRADLSEKGKEITDYIDRHLLDHLSLNDAAKEVGLTPQYLASYFQKNMGITFKDYVNRKKCRLALPLIKYSFVSEEAVSSRLGFTSAASMNKAFSAAYGHDCVFFRPQLNSHCDIDLPEGNIVPDYSAFNEGSRQVEDGSELVGKNTQIVSCNSNPDELITIPTNWKTILNIGISNNLSELPLRNQIVEIQSKMGFQYGRILDLLDNSITRVVDGETLYLFDYIFQSLDFLLELGLKPFIVLGNRFKKETFYMNESASLSVYEDYQNYYRKLELILPPFIRSCVNRYGMNVVNQWIFEVSYDNLSRVQRKQTNWHYVSNYAQVEKIIHSYCPKCKIGGPCFNTLGNLNEFESLLHTFKAEHISPDFLSMGLFGLQEIKGKYVLTPSGSSLIERSSTYMKLCNRYFPKLPVYASEFNMTYDRNNYLNDSVFQACLITWFLLNQGSRFEGIGYRHLSDLTLENNALADRLFYGGSGLLNAVGLRKPSYYSFHFLNELGPIYIHRENGVLVSCWSRYSFQCILYHCPALTGEACESPDNTELLLSDNYAFEPLAPKSVELIINEMIPGQYLVKTYRINRSTGNLLKEYSHLSGISEITPVDMECFRYLSNPGAYLTKILVPEDGIFRFSVSIEALEIVLLHIDFNNRGNNHV